MKFFLAILLLLPTHILSSLVFTAIPNKFVIGKTVTLRCETDTTDNKVWYILKGPDEEAIFYWEKDTYPDPSLKDRVKYNTFGPNERVLNISITPVKREDAADYKCQIRRKDGYFHSNVIHLSVEEATSTALPPTTTEKPKVDFIINPNKCVIGKTVTLRCETDTIENDVWFIRKGPDEKMIFQWEEDPYTKPFLEGRVKYNKFGPNERVLNFSITSVIIEDAAGYKCQIRRGGYYFDSKVIHLSVEEATSTALPPTTTEKPKESSSTKQPAFRKAELGTGYALMGNTKLILLVLLIACTSNVF